MQIKKIDNNKLKVILNSHDLNEKNIDIDSFLSNSIESQDLFFEILDLAEEEYGFNIENNKAIVEAVNLDNNIFVLTITKLKSDSSNIYSNSLKVYCFENINDFLNFSSIIKKNNINLANTYIYKFSEKYFILLSQHDILLENILLEYSVPFKNFNIVKNILIEYGKAIKI